MECSAHISLGTLSCQVSSPHLGPDAQGLIILGGQGVYVHLASENVCLADACEPAAPAGIFQADVNITNLIGQAIGTTDGENVDSAGIRIFFHGSPMVTATTDGQSGLVEVDNPSGTGTFTGADQLYFQYDEVLAPNEKSGNKTWRWSISPNVETFTFQVLVAVVVQYPEGWIDVSPARDTLVTGGPDTSTSQLTAVVRDMIGAELVDEKVTWSSSDTTLLTVDSTGLATAKAGTGSVTVTATAGTRTGKAEIFLVPYAPSIESEDDVFPLTVLGNVSISSGASGFSVTTNDVFSEGATVTFVGWNGTAGKTEHGGNISMTASGAGMGEFTYDPPAGFEGTDAFQYVLSDGVTADTATVTVTVDGMIWFINNAAPNCTSIVAGCGRLSSPLSSLEAFNTANTGVGNAPGDGDVVFIYESGTDYNGPLTLRTGQKLIGQDATESLEAFVGAAPVGSAALPGMAPVNGVRARINGVGGGIVLGSNNTLRGLYVVNTAGTGIHGDGFGLLTLGGDVEVNASGGPAVSLSNGAVSGAFRSLSATAGTNGIVLSNVTGTFQVTGAGTAASGGSIHNTTGDGVLLTNTGPVQLSWMLIQNNGGSGIKGTSVGGFTLRQSSVLNNGNDEGEHGIGFTELTGTARIDTVKAYGAFHDEVHIANSSGTLSLELHGNDFSNLILGPNSSLNDGGVRIDATGTATVNVVADDNTIGNHDGYNFQYVADGAAGGDVKVTNNRLSATHNSSIFIIGGANSAAGVWSGTLTYDVANNAIQDAGNVAVRVGALSSGAAGSARGFVRGNTLGKPGIDGSCGFWGIYAHGDGNGFHVSSVTNNVLHLCRDVAIYPTAHNGAGRHDVVIQGNTVTIVQEGHAPELFPETLQPNVNSGTMCLVAGHPTNSSLKNSLDHRVTHIGVEDLVVVLAGTTAKLILEGYTGSPTDLAAATTFLSSSNTYRGGGPAAVYIEAIMDNYSITGGTCERP